MKFDPTTLEIYRALYTSVAEEMGDALRRTAFSPNIKERRDYSCAVFDADGEVIAMGDHMPVHLGSMPMSVRAAIDHSKIDRSKIDPSKIDPSKKARSNKDRCDLEPGDVVMLNDP